MTGYERAGPVRFVAQRGHKAVAVAAWGNGKRGFPVKAHLHSMMILIGVLLIPVRLAAQAASSEFISFDAPGASSVTASFDGSVAQSINDAGAITGHYVDANTLYHGFLRTPGGEFIIIDAPGVGTSVGFRINSPNGSRFASTITINNHGTITGDYTDAHNVTHGFVRSPSGKFTTFDAPGARSVEGAFEGTLPCSINNEGTITGNYMDSKEVIHGFLRNPAGGFITFDVPGASSAAGNGTFPKRINDAGAVAGHYTDAHYLMHGFVRSPSGQIATFDAPDADKTAGSGNGSFPNSINSEGTITGYYTDTKNVIHGFVRSPGGEFNTFDAPGAGSVAASGYGTFPNSINDAGAVAGHYTDAQGVTHGFERNPSGKIVTFDARGAGSMAASGYGTFPESINGAGAITGRYADDHGIIHGFLRRP